MGTQHQGKRRAPDHGRLQNSRTPRFDLPVRTPGVWRFLLDQLMSAATRIHRYRTLSAQALEDTIREIDRGCCK